MLFTRSWSYLGNEDKMIIRAVTVCRTDKEPCTQTLNRIGVATNPIVLSYALLLEHITKFDSVNNNLNFERDEKISDFSGAVDAP